MKMLARWKYLEELSWKHGLGTETKPLMLFFMVRLVFMQKNLGYSYPKITLCVGV